MKERKKILVVGYNMKGQGGKETVCRKFFDLLSTDSSGADVEFLFIDDYKQGVGEVCDNWLGNAPFSRVTSAVANTKIRRLSFAVKLAGVVRLKKPDLVVAIDPLSCYISNLARVISMRKFNIFSWIHTSLDVLYKAIYVTKADFHLAISSGITQQLSKMGVVQSNIFLVHNSVARTSMLLPRPKGAASFIYIGRLSDKDKNVSELLSSLSNVLGEWTLHIIGSGPDERMYRDLAKELNIDHRIVWHGWREVPWDYVFSEIKEVSALLLTSRIEGFGMSLAEAMSYGVYCVSSDCQSGPSDIIRESVNGELYPPGRVDILTARLQSIVGGASLPDGEKIRESIEHLYDDAYLTRIKCALKI
ncbi:glycosyltransferase [Hahella sp. KA22]|uniref:glycosyltransferase n=1 Tax=Hahella sp. KA22 TaxID=1628392 RepID=UPI000FDE06C6|nr:glycosyltransferase [Hahella sp. KA22]AZZ90466.1 glycosyltransferase [Hahella sp. KA22]QAY53835.1 glycosyltransferase [Hahella sp. KA22]